MTESDPRRPHTRTPLDTGSARVPGSADFRSSPLGWTGYGAAHLAHTGASLTPSGTDNEVSESFRGKGPRQDVRSDARIHEDVCESLTVDAEIDASEISVHCSEGVVMLEGPVSSRSLKHHIENRVAGRPGVRDVDNRLRVERR